MLRKLVVAGIAAVGILSAPSASGARAPMRYVYHPPESSLDVRYLYHWEILRTALEKTQPKWGAFEMVPSEMMSERRQAFELKNATGKLTIMYLSTTPEFEKTLTPVRIPVDRNLGGYGVFLIRREDQKRFTPVRTVEDLRRFRYGLGLDWIDVGILRSNGLTVVTGSNYEGLFEMLNARRFDIFLRGAVEVLDEYDRHKEALPDLAVEQNLILYYPLPMYFWFASTREGRRLAARVEEGMRTMIADGTYDQIFNRHYRSQIERLRLKQRRIVRITNPNLGPETPLADKRLWFDPRTYR